MGFTRKAGKRIKTMSIDTKALVQQVASSVDLIGGYLQSTSKEEFIKSTQTQDAVLNRIRIISDVAQQIPKASNGEISGVAWDTLGAMAENVLKNHFEFDVNNLWQVATEQLPEHSESLDAILHPPFQRFFGKGMFDGDDMSIAARNLLGCVFHLPKANFPVKLGTITEVQWYDIESRDPETTEDKQGDALMMEPGQVFFFEAMGNMVLLISALSENTRACVRINAVAGVADKAQMLVRALGITSFNRDKHQFSDILNPESEVYITPSEIDVPEPETFVPRHSKMKKGLRITI